MNKHILLVMKWLKNPESVSQEELDANFESARSAATSRANSAADDDVYNAAADEAAYAASRTAAVANRDANRESAYRESAYRADYAAYAAAWVDKYFKYTGEDKQTYIGALGE
jgi:hypothetical protein